MEEFGVMEREGQRAYSYNLGRLPRLSREVES